MKIILTIGMLFALIGCTTTSDRSTKAETAKNDHVEMVEVYDPESGEKSLIPASEIFKLVDVENPPVVLSEGKPNLPEGFDTVVRAVATFTVTTDGEAEDIEILEINQKEYSYLIVETLNLSEFKPASHYGKLVPARVRIPVKLEPEP